MSVFAVVFVQTQSRAGLSALRTAASLALVVAGPLRGRLTAVILVAGAIGVLYYVYAASPQVRERVASIVTG